jgi:hypothetical protein
MLPLTKRRDVGIPVDELPSDPTIGYAISMDIATTIYAGTITYQVSRSVPRCENDGGGTRYS